MEFILNDLSMSGQFANLPLFSEAVGRVMSIRGAIQQHGYSLYCHRNLTNAKVTPDVTMCQAVQSLTREKQRAWMQWLTRQGPHWEDSQLHSGDDFLEVNGDLVTESAIGEAAICIVRGLPRVLVSFKPSSWLRTPIEVKWVRDDDTKDIRVPNHWELNSIQQTLEVTPRPVASWSDLATRSIQRCSRLTFSEEAFIPLKGHPFAPGAARRIHVLLNTLNQLKSCFDADGSRNLEGHCLYNDHFTGAKAWFSDSSNTEKRDFKKELTFHHPENAAEKLCCTWHGKVKTPQYRIHFSWPVTATDPIYVVYVGPKITKR